MPKARIVFKDRAGNKLLRKIIKSKGTVQYSAKNAENKLVRKTGVIRLIKMMNKRRMR